MPSCTFYFICTTTDTPLLVQVALGKRVQGNLTANLHRQAMDKQCPSRLFSQGARVNK
jgi:hypothetical protein